MQERARQALTYDSTITEIILKKELVAANSLSTFYITQELDNDAIITIIEQIKQNDMAIERKKEILRTRVIFWQRTLKTLQPNGLNKRIGQREGTQIPL